MPKSVTVVSYNPEWPRRFEQERAILEVVFALRDVHIEHVGSTAVPDLGAKPVIDIMIGLPQLSDAEDRIGMLEAVGYEYVPTNEEQIPERRYFRKPRSGRRGYHLHCVLKGSDFWVRQLAFRDYLRAHPETSADYFRLKCELAMRCSKDEYTEAKSPFIERILAFACGHER